MSFHTNSERAQTVRHLLLAIAAAVAMLLVMPVALPVLGRNQWSLAALKALVAKAPLARAVEGAAHPRETLWRAQSALLRGDVDEVLAAVESEQSPASADPLLAVVLGEALARQGRVTDAIEQWRSAGAAEKLIEQGWLAYGEGRWMDAEALFEAAWALQPELGALGLANTLLSLRRPADAEAVLRQSIGELSASGDRTELRLLLARTMAAQERWSDAEQILRALLADEPTNVQAQVSLGRVLYALEGYVSARSALDRVIELAPANVAGYETLADILFAEGRYAEADEMYVKAIERSASSMWLQLRWAHNALAAGNHVAAIERYQDAINTFGEQLPAPQLSAVYCAQAQSHLMLGQIAEASAAAAESLALDDRDANCWIIAGQIYEATKQVQQAVQAYQQALALDPGNSLAQQGLEKLSASD